MTSDRASKRQSVHWPRPPSAASALCSSLRTVHTQHTAPARSNLISATTSSVPAHAASWLAQNAAGSPCLPRSPRRAVRSARRTSPAAGCWLILLDKIGLSPIDRDRDVRRWTPFQIPTVRFARAISYISSIYPEPPDQKGETVGGGAQRRARARRTPAARPATLDRSARGVCVVDAVAVALAVTRLVWRSRRWR